MSLTIVRHGPGRIGSTLVLGDLLPGDTVSVNDDNGRIVLSLTVPNLNPDYVSNTGDTSSSRAFLRVEKDVLVCDERGTTIPVAGVRLQLDH